MQMETLLGVHQLHNKRIEIASVLLPGNMTTSKLLAGNDNTGISKLRLSYSHVNVSETGFMVESETLP